MGKKTKKEKNSIEEGLDIQMNLAGDLAARNPWFQELYQKFPNRFINEAFDRFEGIDYKEYYKEYDRSFHEIWGDIFPTFPYPVLQLKDLSKRPSELVLTIDLNYTKDEIMFRIEQFVKMGLKKYRELKRQRKFPEKWRDYLEIWDLKDGRQPWVKDSRGVPFLQKSLKKTRRPRTYEEIAKYKYPDMQTPEEMRKAIDRVKKQYRAAQKLICGTNYPYERKHIENTNAEKTCAKCPDRAVCKDLCPPMINEVQKGEKKSQEWLLLGTSKDLEKLNKKTRRAKPTAE